MKLGRVVGTVVSTVKAPTLSSYKLLLVLPFDVDREDQANHSDVFVAIDLVGAGEGDVVLISTGSAARIGPSVGAVPTDASIVAMVDTVRVGDRCAYSRT